MFLKDNYSAEKWKIFVNCFTPDVEVKCERLHGYHRYLNKIFLELVKK